MAAKAKKKKKTGPAPADPVGGAKTNLFTMKMNALEIAMIQTLADKHGVSRAQMLRLLVHQRYMFECQVEQDIDLMMKAEQPPLKKKRGHET